MTHHHNPDIDYDTAQERGRFMLAAAKVLVRLQPQLLLVHGLHEGMVTWPPEGLEYPKDWPEGLEYPKDLVKPQDELHFEDHVEALALGWTPNLDLHTRLP